VFIEILFYGREAPKPKASIIITALIMENNFIEKEALNQLQS